MNTIPSPHRRPSALNPRHHGNVVTGCLIAVGILALLIIAGIVVVAMNAKKWATAGVHAVAVEVVKDSDMTEADKTAIIVELDGLKAGVDSGDVTMEDLGRVMEEMVESPLIPAAGMTFIKKQYIEPSGLSDEEKADAKLQVGRFARGVFEGQIPQEAIEEATAPISEPDPQNPGQTRLKENATDEEVRQFIANIRQRADDAGVSSEPYEIDVPAEFKKVLDRALNRTPSESEAGGEPSEGASTDTPTDAPAAESPAESASAK